jgi:hypothetical protein
MTIFADDRVKTLTSSYQQAKRKGSLSAHPTALAEKNRTSPLCHV